ncbi:MAG: hypothetical protein DRP02_07415 [Candidatus Gerdarchaeota archaeon]|nr:MAG: hypothetical protein DRO63_04390 [Candidatus Gerdarchaeota archaeon]RLI70580.1 MAG: hypothetical protein DRP02_07415 [Candidatus Gerdarchaeota archaeon]
MFSSSFQAHSIRHSTRFYFPLATIPLAGVLKFSPKGLFFCIEHFINIKERRKRKIKNLKDAERKLF